jgi:hypothetical protein
MAAPAWCAAADKLYFFVDEQGVPHYSNVPADPRYKPLGQPGAERGGAAAPVAPPPASATAVPLAPVPIIPAGEMLPPDQDDDDR